MLQPIQTSNGLVFDDRNIQKALYGHTSHTSGAARGWIRNYKFHEDVNFWRYASKTLNNAGKPSWARYQFSLSATAQIINRSNNAKVKAWFNIQYKDALESMPTNQMNPLVETYGGCASEEMDQLSPGFDVPITPADIWGPEALPAPLEAAANWNEAVETSKQLYPELYTQTEQEEPMTTDLVKLSVEEMMEAMPAELCVIGGHEHVTALLRDAYTFLGIGKQYGSWADDQLRRAQLVENTDFKVIPLKGKNPLGGRPSIEHRCTKDAIIKVCMLSETTKGNLVREYFIEAEKRLFAGQAHNPAPQVGDLGQVLTLAINQAFAQTIAPVQSKLDALAMQIDRLSEQVAVPAVATLPAPVAKEAYRVQCSVLLTQVMPLLVVLFPGGACTAIPFGQAPLP